MGDAAVEEHAHAGRDPVLVTSARIGADRAISIGDGATGMMISSAACIADRAIAAWSSVCGESITTMSSGRAWAPILA